MFFGRTNLRFICIALVGIRGCLAADAPSTALNLGKIKNIYAVLETFPDLDQAVTIWRQAMARKELKRAGGLPFRVTPEASRKYELLEEIPNVSSLQALWFQARSEVVHLGNLDVADVDTVLALTNVIGLQRTWLRQALLYPDPEGGAVLGLNDATSNATSQLALQQLISVHKFLIKSRVGLLASPIKPPTIIADDSLPVIPSEFGTKLDQIGNLVDRWQRPGIRVVLPDLCIADSNTAISESLNLFDIEKKLQIGRSLWIGFKTGDSPPPLTYSYPNAAEGKTMQCLPDVVAVQERWYTTKWLNMLTAFGGLYGTYTQNAEMFRAMAKVTQEYLKDVGLQGYPGLPNDSFLKQSIADLDSIASMWQKLYDANYKADAKPGRRIVYNGTDMSGKDVIRTWEMRLLQLSWKNYFANRTAVDFNSTNDPFYIVTGQVGSGIEFRSDDDPKLGVGSSPPVTTVPPGSSTTTSPNTSQTCPASVSRGLSSGESAAIVLACLNLLLLLMIGGLLIYKFWPKLFSKQSEA